MKDAAIERTTRHDTNVHKRNDEHDFAGSVHLTRSMALSDVVGEFDMDKPASKPPEDVLVFNAGKPCSRSALFKPGRISNARGSTNSPETTLSK